MFKRSEEYFNLPQEIKMKQKKPNIIVNRGYSPIGAEKLTNLDKDFGADSFSISTLNSTMPD
jgi:isopenicillin N synthase-like dioxygenase